MRGRRRTRVIAAIISPLVFLGLVEGILRVAGYRYDPQAEERAEQAGQTPAVEFARHPTLLWTLPPDSRIDVPEHGYPDVKTNRLGLRGELPDPERLPGEIRILCLGDSITFGLGLAAGDTWPARLRAHLTGHPGLDDRPITVLNGAVPGWSSVQGMRLLSELEWFEPDLVVFWFGMNDVQEIQGRPDARRGEASGILHDVAVQLSRLRTVQLVARIRDAAQGDGDGVRASVADFASAVERLEARADEGGPSVLFVACPDRMADTERQLAGVLARMEEVSVDRVVGPRKLLLPITPAPVRGPIEGRVAPGPEGPELVLEGRDLERWKRARIERGLACVRAWRTGLAARRACLPEDALGAEEIFGDKTPGEVFLDNCHLSPAGCECVARAVARRVLARPGK